jgi:hypothetical protein
VGRAAFACSVVLLRCTELGSLHLAADLIALTCREGGEGADLGAIATADSRSRAGVGEVLALIEAARRRAY